jgi:hypothetical protein
LIITAFYRRIDRNERLKSGRFFGSNLDWRTKTTETRPDGTQRIVYANARTQPMLEVIRTTEGGVTRQQGTYTRYDARGQAIWQVSPEAIKLPANQGKAKRAKKSQKGRHNRSFGTASITQTTPSTAWPRRDAPRPRHLFRLGSPGLWPPHS